jgi:hypothetical protein
MRVESAAGAEFVSRGVNADCAWATVADGDSATMTLVTRSLRETLNITGFV